MDIWYLPTITEYIKLLISPILYKLSPRSLRSRTTAFGSSAVAIASESWLLFSLSPFWVWNLSCHGTYEVHYCYWVPNCCCICCVVNGFGRSFSIVLHAPIISRTWFVSGAIHRGSAHIALGTPQRTGRPLFISRFCSYCLGPASGPSFYRVVVHDALVHMQMLVVSILRPLSVVSVLIPLLRSLLLPFWDFFFLHILFRELSHGVLRCCCESVRAWRSV